MTYTVRLFKKSTTRSERIII